MCEQMHHHNNHSLKAWVSYVTDQHASSCDDAAPTELVNSSAIDNLSFRIKTLTLCMRRTGSLSDYMTIIRYGVVSLITQYY